MAFRMPMKQIGGKNLGFRVELMEWSDKMDLIAIANEKGEIIIQRLNWQKVVVFPAIGEGIKVKALAWQPSEAVIAAGYSNGKVCLLDIEKEDEIHSFICDSEINTVNWKKTNIKTRIDETSPKDEDYLSPLPNLNTFSSTSRKAEFCSTKSFAKGPPNFLIISTVTGQILLSVFGLLQCGTINISDHIGGAEKFEVHDVRISSTFNELFVFVSRDGILELIVFENKVLSKYVEPLFKLARRHGSVVDTMNYINETIQCIIEAWETVLLEMDNKLTKYANSQPEGSISADFLELLMFGYPSEALEQFLVRDLTEKGLKKLGNSIELSYSTIQKLVVRPLHCATANLIFHLNAIKGSSLFSYHYAALLDPKCAENAMRSAGSFLIKIFELQQVISQSVIDYKTFWCWLYMVIIRLMDENVPDEVSSVSQQDITYLAEFLYSFDDCIFEKEDGSVGKRKFNLERVGQYLEDSNLQIPSKHEDWTSVLSENECLKNSPLIYPHHKNASLIQEFNMVKESVKELFRRANVSIGENFHKKVKIICSHKPSPEMPVYTAFIAEEVALVDTLIATTMRNQMILVEFSTTHGVKASKLIVKNGNCSTESANDLAIKHLQLYNEKTVSLLLSGVFNNRLIDSFVQLGTRGWRLSCSSYPVLDEIDIRDTANCECVYIGTEHLSKAMEGSTCLKMAVSGSRKVASILSDNGRKIRLYEMEVEDEDDEMEPTLNLFASKETA